MSDHGRTTRRDFIGASAIATGALLAPGQGAANPTARGSFLDVRDFGAVGDEKTDDTPSLQRAINAGADAGMPVFLAPCRGYRVASGPIVMERPVTLFGTGSVAAEVPIAAKIRSVGSILLNDTPNQPLLLIRHTAAPALACVCIRDLYIHGNLNVAGSTSGAGIAIIGGAPSQDVSAINGILIQNVTIKEAAGDGLLIQDGAFNSNFWLVVADHCGGNGIRINTTELDGVPGQNRFVGCTTSRNKLSGFRQEGRGTNFVTGLQTVENKEWGIHVSKADLRVTQSQLERNVQGGFLASKGAGAGCSLTASVLGQLTSGTSSVRIEADGCHLGDLTFSTQRRPANEIEIAAGARWTHLGAGLRLVSGQPAPKLRISDQGSDTIRAGG